MNLFQRSKYKGKTDVELQVLYRTYQDTPEVEKEEALIKKELERRGYKLNRLGIWVKE